MTDLEKVVNKSRIHVNGRPSSIDNIFDMVNPERPDLWYTVTSQDTGRPIKVILKEWADNHKTYYFIKGKKNNI